MLIEQLKTSIKKHQGKYWCFFMLVYKLDILTTASEVYRW
ncbi:hypothetical protein Niako_0021 [Niastella koreensis GR20-10]|uniref:Uncharacterized protein n=1 Tax=Niastella koreensis (strain DSM 17620 / KACC 11465 / NBRC 106392 / GR20-10) TaxID=700598 RepID=G8TIS9_NIAKG|nr:hypothetical protein Niako_0021 [Niastella koreensis GR20-10]